MKEKANKLMYPDGMIVERELKRENDIKINENNNDDEQSRKRFKPSSSSSNSTDNSV